MITKNDVLNKISNFNCTIDAEKIKFPGILQEVNGNIVLNAMVSVDQYQKMLSSADFNILGSIFGKEATLIGCHIHSTSGSMGSNDVSLLIIPSEIIVGKCFVSIPMVKRITLSTPDLNYMFAGTSPLEPNRNITKENPSVLNFTYPKPIRTQDKYGEIELYQKYISHDSARKEYLHTIISVVAYSFASPLSLMDAVAKAFAAINLFSFFGNGYISCGEISFQVENDRSEYILLSVAEVEKYFISDESRIADLHSAVSNEYYSDRWWLRTSGVSFDTYGKTYYRYGAVCIGNTGAVSYGGNPADNINGVRPAMWISLK